MRKNILTQSYLRLTPNTRAAPNPAMMPAAGAGVDVSILPLNKIISDSRNGKYESGDIYSGYYQKPCAEEDGSGFYCGASLGSFVFFSLHNRV